MLPARNFVLPLAAPPGLQLADSEDADVGAGAGAAAVGAPPRLAPDAAGGGLDAAITRRWGADGGGRAAVARLPAAAADKEVWVVTEGGQGYLVGEMGPDPAVECIVHSSCCVCSGSDRYRAEVHQRG